MTITNLLTVYVLVHYEYKEQAFILANQSDHQTDMHFTGC